MPGPRQDLASRSLDGRLLVVGPPSGLREEVLRLAAATGVLAHSVEAAQLSGTNWSDPHLILVDAVSVAEVCAAAMPRRSGVLIVTSAPPEEGVWSAAVGIGAEQVLELPGAEARLVDRLSDVVGGSEPLGALVAIIGGCGGAGASTLASALAVNAARAGQQPVLLGADPWDGGIDLCLGGEAVPGPRWPDLAAVSGRLSTAAILEGLPEVHGVRFLSSDRSQPTQVPLAALSAVVDAARRTGGPVIVDLPRGTGEAARWLGGVVDLGLVVSSATVPAALATRGLVAELAWAPGNCGLVLRPELGRDIDDLAISGAVGLPVVARLRQDRMVPRQRQRGEPPAGHGSLAKACAALWRLAADHRALAA